MRRISVLATAVAVTSGLASLAPIAMSAAWADTSNADICASKDDDAFPPQRRIEACSTLIDQVKDQPAALVDALINRGTVYWYINKMDPGFTDFDRAIALDPNNARAFRERANAYRTQGRLDKALSDANQAVRLDPNDATALNVRANIFNNNHQYDRAIADYNEGLRLKPNDAQLLMDRGAAYYFKADYQNAMKDYNAAISVDPNKAQAFSNRAAVYKKLGQIDRAITDGTQAIKLDPLTPEYFDNRGLDYAENGDYDRAIADYDAAIKLKPQANFLTNRGDSYYFKKDYDRAIADYDRAVALNPGFFLAYNNRGGAYDKKGDFDHAIADYEQALRINPQFDKAAEKSRRCAAGARPAHGAEFRQYAADLRLPRGEARGRESDLLRSRSVAARSRDRCRLSGRAGDAQRQAAHAVAPGAARLHHRAQHGIRQSAIQSQAPDGIAARGAARLERGYCALADAPDRETSCPAAANRAWAAPDFRPASDKVGFHTNPAYQRTARPGLWRDLVPAAALW